MKDWKTIAIVVLSVALTICLFIIFSGNKGEIDMEKYNKLEQENKELLIQNDSLVERNVYLDEIIVEKDSLMQLNQVALDSNQRVIDDLNGRLDDIDGEVQNMSDGDIVNYLKNYLNK